MEWMDHWRSFKKSHLLVAKLIVSLLIFPTFFGPCAGAGSGDVDLIPKLSIDGIHAFNQVIECRVGSTVNATEVDLSMSVVQCASRAECDAFLQCLSSNSTCENTKTQILPGELCPQSTRTLTKSFKYQDNCLLVSPTSINFGMVECSSKSKMDGQIRRTVDYFYYGTDYHLYLVSNSSVPASTRFRTEIKKWFTDINNDDSPWNGKLYTDEDVKFVCTASEVFYNGSTLRMDILKTDGSSVKISPNWFVSYSHRNYKVLLLFNARMLLKNLAGVSCIVEKRRDSPFQNGAAVEKIMNNTVNFVTIDPPMDLVAKSNTGKEFRFNFTDQLGCMFNGSFSDKTDLDRKFVPVDQPRDYDSHDDTKVIDTVIQFLRFREFSRGHYSCKNLGGNVTTQNFTENFHYLVSLAQSPPTILTTDGSQQKVVTLTGHDHRTLSCKYSGNPKPSVVWYRDDKSLLDELSWSERSSFDTESDKHESRLILPPATDSTNRITNYSCVVSNHLGEDSFHFLIGQDGGWDYSSNYCLAVSWLLGLTAIALIISILFSLRKHLGILKDILFKRDDQQHLQLEEQQ